MENHPASRSARILVALVRSWIRARFHVEVHGFEHFSSSPSTLVVSNHRRDADGPIIGTMLLGRMDELGAGTAPWFVAREDLFRRGFLRNYMTGWPAPVRALLGTVDLRSVLEVLHLRPIRRIRERTLGEVLEDLRVVLGDLPLAEVLRPRVLDGFLRLSSPGTAPARVSDVLGARYRSLLLQKYGLMKLTRACFRMLRPYEEATIEKQLEGFVELLDEGAVLLLEPEGAISVDGSLGRLRGALHVLLNRPSVPVRVLPVGIVYDFMTTGRPWAFINYGREIPDLGGLSRRATTERVTEAMLARSTMTASLLASRWLLRMRSYGGGTVTADELADHVRVSAERCAESGMPVDPRLLDPRERQRRIADYLAYCSNCGALVPSDGGRYLVRADGSPSPPGWPHPGNVLDYVHNQLTSLGPHWSELAGGDP